MKTKEVIYTIVSFIYLIAGLWLLTAYASWQVAVGVCLIVFSIRLEILDKLDELH